MSVDPHRCYINSKRSMGRGREFIIIIIIIIIRDNSLRKRKREREYEYEEEKVRGSITAYHHILNILIFFIEIKMIKLLLLLNRS